MSPLINVKYLRKAPLSPDERAAKVWGHRGDSRFLEAGDGDRKSKVQLPGCLPSTSLWNPRLKVQGQEVSGLCFCTAGLVGRPEDKVLPWWYPLDTPLAWYPHASLIP